MRSVELTAKSVDEARKLAAGKLGVSADQVKVTVLEETKALFGKTNVRVRAEAAEEIPAAPKTPKVNARQAKKAAVESEPLQAIQNSFEQESPAEAAPAPAEPKAESNGEVEGPEIVASQEDADRLQALILELVQAADLDVTAQAVITGGRYVNVVLDGKDVAFLVGKHGEVLNAMQYLVNITASRRFNNGVRATLDGNDFRRRREDALTTMAQKIAEQVRMRREEAVLDALPAFERRVVHKALSTLEGVTTYSEGEEPNRRVVIAPAD